MSMISFKSNVYIKEVSMIFVTLDLANITELKIYRASNLGNFKKNKKY